MAVGSHPRRVLIAFPQFQSAYLRGIVRYADSAGWSIDSFAPRMELLPSNWDGEGILTQYTEVPEINARISAFLARTGQPSLTLGEPPAGVDLPSVQRDHAATARLAAEYFLGRNFRSFLCVHGPLDLRVHALRRKYFSEQLARVGIFSQMFEWDWTSPHSSDVGRHLARLIRHSPRPLAVWAVTDHLAVHVVEVAREMGLHVPGEIAILGCDNDAVAAGLARIPLSTIDTLEEVGYRAASILDTCIDGADLPASRVLVEPQGVITRETTDTVAAHSPPVAKAIEFMSRHVGDDVRADEISRAAGVSAATLFAAFRRDVRRSPMSMLLEMRLREAEHLLAETNEKLEFIAVTCGFKSNCNFSRVFRKAHGMTPLEWRRARQARRLS